MRGLSPAAVGILGKWLPIPIAASSVTALFLIPSLSALFPASLSGRPRISGRRKWKWISWGAQTLKNQSRASDTVDAASRTRKSRGFRHRRRLKRRQSTTELPRGGRGFPTDPPWEVYSYYNIDPHNLLVNICPK